MIWLPTGVLRALHLSGVLKLDGLRALRGLRRSPAFTLVAVVSLALASGANAFAFAVLRTIDLRPAEVDDAGSVHQLRYGPGLAEAT